MAEITARHSTRSESATRALAAVVGAALFAYGVSEEAIQFRPVLDLAWSSRLLGAWLLIGALLVVRYRLRHIVAGLAVSWGVRLLALGALWLALEVGRRVVGYTSTGMGTPADALAGAAAFVGWFDLCVGARLVTELDANLWAGAYASVPVMVAAGYLVATAGRAGRRWGSGLLPAAGVWLSVIAGTSAWTAGLVPFGAMFVAALGLELGLVWLAARRLSRREARRG